MLSAVLSGRRALSRTLAQKIGKNLGVTADDLEYFCDLAESSCSRSAVRKRLARARLETVWAQEISFFGLDAFRFMSDWYHLAILELISLESFRPDPLWIAKKLGVSASEVREAVARLVRLGVLEIRSDGSWAPLAPFVAGPDGIPSEAVRRFHAQVLARATASLETQNILERDISTVFMAFDSGQLDEAKKLIKEFRRSFSKKMPRPRKLDSLYSLGIQFVRLDEKNV
jgi:uncharacterized protein (TIGR02147 family)